MKIILFSFNRLPQTGNQRTLSHHTIIQESTPPGGVSEWGLLPVPCGGLAPGPKTGGARGGGPPPSAPPGPPPGGRTLGGIIGPRPMPTPTPRPPPPRPPPRAPNSPGRGWPGDCQLPSPGPGAPVGFQVPSLGPPWVMPGPSGPPGGPNGGWPGGPLGGGPGGPRPENIL